VPAVFKVIELTKVMNDFPKTRDLPGGNCTIAWPIDYFVSD